MWPEASRLVHFCCSHQVAHFLSSSVISVISCSLSMSPCVSAVVSVHCNIIKWWHKLVFPFVLFSRLGLKPCFTLQGSNSQNTPARKVLGHFGNSICGHTMELLELGARFVSAAANIPAHLRVLWRENLRRRARREDNSADCCSAFLPFPNNAQPPVAGGGGQQVLDDGGADAIHFSHLFATHESNRAPLETSRIVPATPGRTSIISSGTRPDCSRTSYRRKEAIQLLTHVTRVSQRWSPPVGELGARESWPMWSWRLKAFFFTAASRPNSIVKAEPSDLICYSVSVGLLLTSFHSACN